MKKESTSWNIFPILLLVTGMVFNVLSLTAQTSHSVTVSGFTFSPKNITVNAGDTVTWKNDLGTHNVNGTKVTYPGNPESFGNAVGTGWTYTHIFNIPGVYNYRCDPHFEFGMTGTVTVEEAVSVYKLTVSFSSMTPHLGQRFLLYVRDQSTGLYLDTTGLETIAESSFVLESFVIQPGGSYWIDFYADHNKNGEYDAPPTDHAWRILLNNVDGDTNLEFVHNTSFTDIFNTAGVPSITSEKQVLLYPNPAKDFVTVDLSQTGEKLFSVKFLDLLGKELASYDYISNNSYQGFNLSSFSPGVYLMQVKTESKIRILKLVIR